MNELLDEYPTMVIVAADNVKSQQFHNARKALRHVPGGATILMGKNTLMRRGLKDRFAADKSAANQKLLDMLMPQLKFNVGLILCKGEATEVLRILRENRVQAPAKANTIAPMDVHVEAMNTGLEPTKTQIFQQLNIPTKIVKQSVEILKPVHLIKAGTKVGASEAGLLQLLNINPFHYGLDVITVYDDGALIPKEVLEITDEQFKEKINPAVENLRALALGANYTCAATLPTTLQTALKELVSLGVGCESYVPSKIGSLVSDIREGKVAAAPSGGGGAAPAKEEKAAAPVEEEDDDDEGGLDLPW
jgi:large subunit ribosomal protein LP0